MFIILSYGHRPSMQTQDREPTSPVRFLLAPLLSGDQRIYDYCTKRTPKHRQTSHIKNQNTGSLPLAQV
jgi:hypothetical protein